MRERLTNLITAVWNRMLRPAGYYTWANTRGTVRRTFSWDEGTKECPKPRPKGAMPHGGSYSLSFGKEALTLTTMFKLDHDGDGDNVSLILGIPFLFYFYASLEYCYPAWIERITGKYASRVWGFSVHCKYGIDLVWNNSDPTMGDEPHGWNWHYRWERLKGKQTCTTWVLQSMVAGFEQPASHGWPATKHEATLKLTRMHWHWGNWFVKDFERTFWDISLSRPPKFGGKGENGWDCGHDGTYGMDAPGHLTRSEAIEHYIAHVKAMRDARG